MACLKGDWSLASVMGAVCGSVAMVVVDYSMLFGELTCCDLVSRRDEQVNSSLDILNSIGQIHAALELLYRLSEVLHGEGRQWRRPGADGLPWLLWWAPLEVMYHACCSSHPPGDRRVVI